MGRDDDEAWRAIVDNYGDRVLDDESPTDAQPEREPEPSAQVSPGVTSWDDPFPDADWSSDSFVPPPPPPLPVLPTDRLVAWAGVFGSPLVLLVCLLAGFTLPSLLAYGLVAAFVGGFLYLVFKMPREPRDPDDDGAVL